MTAAVSPGLPFPSLLGWALLLGLTVWAVRRAGPGDDASGWKWWALCALTLLCFRWPLWFVQHQLNPDESQLIAGAITLRHDPVFWRSLDGNTGGPLDYYPLLPSAWATGVDSYVVARLIGLAATFATLFLAAETLALFAGASLARIVVLPALAAAAFTTCPDFLFYATETMPVLVLAAGGYAAARHGRKPTRGWLWMTAFLLGCVPWTKLQAVPIAAALWLLVVVREFRAGRTSSLVPLLVVGLVPTAICFGVAQATGQFDHLWVPYVLQNLAYVADPHFSWMENAAQQGLNAFSDGYLGFWLTGSAVVLLVIVIRFVRSAPLANRHMAWAALALFAVGIYSALGPRRPSAHHLQLVVVPLVWLTGAGLALAWTGGSDAARRRGLTLGFLACTLLPLATWRVAGHDAYAAMNADVLSPARQRLSQLVDQFSAPEETLGIWGWRCSLYVEAGRPQATRQGHTEPQLNPGPFQRYYLRRYLEDIRAANPPVFADAVGPGGFAFTDRDRAHECFPPLRDWVRGHYTQIADLDGTRVYVRNDRLAEVMRPTDTALRVGPPLPTKLP